MRLNRQLATRITVVAASLVLAASSAFADSRHQKETRARVERQHNTRQERSAPQAQSQRSYGLQRVQTGEARSYQRPSSSHTQNYEHYQGNNSSYRGNNNSHRGNNNSYGGNNNGYRGNNNGYRGGNGTYHGSSHGYGYSPHQSYYHSGRISHYEPYHGGYRVYVAGAPFPFFVPFAYWDPFRFRIGITIGLGGYYNPGGYYDYYGYAPPPPYYSGPVAAPAAPAAVSSGVLRGTVESVDYRALTFVLRNESTGTFVTVDNGGRENRDVRPGDYVEVSGNWDHDYFIAYNIAYLNTGNPGYNNDQYPR